jgi:hypothetical protein
MGGLSSPAAGALIEFTMTGVMEFGNGSDVPPWDDSMVGEAFEVRFRYDDATPGAFLFVDVVEELTVTIGDVSETTNTGTIRLRSGVTASDGLVSDQFSLGGAPLPSGHFAGIVMNRTYDPRVSESLFSDGTLPSSLSVGDFMSPRFTLVAPVAGQLNGEILSITSREVPTPSTLALLIGGCLFAHRRRKK